MKEWYQVDKIGKLYEEKILVETNEPILFLCVDEKNNRYLVEAIDGFEGEFVIARINDIILNAMLNHTVTMYYAFKQSETLLHTSFDENYNLKSEVYSNYDIPDELLPRKNGILYTKEHPYRPVLEKDSITFDEIMNEFSINIKY